MTTSDFFSPPPDRPPTEREIVSVSQLNRRARQLLETHIPLLWVEGELSNVSTPSSGHWYFTLKDDQAQVRCAMFRNRNMQVRFRPQQGQQVLVRARVSLYEGRGDYQIIVEHMEEAGAGALQRAFEQLKARLAQEGLFDPGSKKTLPALPRRIGVITSPTGAAIRDILSVLERRFASTPVTVIPVAVQGKEAAPQIVRALELANRSGLFDVLILARGGGSLEDLWPFNEEIVARAIYASQVPVISGIGHEVDFTIADFVADVRAPTPSAAAELVVPDGDDWLDKFIGFEVLLEEAMLRQLRHWQQLLTWLRQRLRHPRERLEQQSQRLDNLELRLKAQLQRQLSQYRHHLEQLRLRLQPHHPKLRLARLQEQITQQQQRLVLCQQRQLQQRQQRLGEALRLLNMLNPLNTLERGYALASRVDSRQLITRSSQLSEGDLIHTQVSEGSFISRVEKVNRAQPTATKD